VTRALDKEPQQEIAEIAGRLTLLRNWLGLSQAEMAFRLGMNVPGVCHVGGTHRPAGSGCAPSPS